MACYIPSKIQDERRAGQKKGHGVAVVICFECGSMARGKKKIRRGGGPAGTSTWREKEGVKGGPIMAVGSAGRLAAAPSHRGRVAPLLRKQGRAAIIGDAVTQANVADKRYRGEAGPGVSSGVWERAKGRETRRRRGADTWAWVAQHRAARFKLGLNRNQNSNETKLISNSFIL
jgi:hypothetical protein